VILRKGAEEEVLIRLGTATLPGIVDIPEDAAGIVLFAHGSGSSRWSPRNQFVARKLQEARLGTMLVDLMTGDEDQRYSRRFDIPFLAERLSRITEWLRERIVGTSLRMGYFGASTGAAAALRAAVGESGSVAAIVSRGGRPDLADEVLPEVEAPTLFIVGGNDEPVLSLNVAAYQRLRCSKELSVISSATHLFEEPGALDEVARRAADWFRRFLPDRSRS
jgi:pimeloyl-ACP methyl ester carboxylesterase